jgi:uncharacterized protein YdaU (DUF1376 family)
MEESAAPPAFQFYPRDFIASRTVALMSPEARGGYIMLLCHAWLSDDPGTLPDDDRVLSVLSGLGDRWSFCADSIKLAFERGSADAKPMLTQPRLKHEREQQIAYRCQQALAGTASAVKLSAEQRSERASHAAQARWHANDAHEMLAHAKSASSSASASASAESKKLTPSLDQHPSSETHNGSANGHDPDHLTVRQWFLQVFWPYYPRKVGKRAAFRRIQVLFRSAGPALEDDLGDAIMNSVDQFKRGEWSTREPALIPHAATFLNREDFLDAR